MFTTFNSTLLPRSQYFLLRYFGGDFDVTLQCFVVFVSGYSHYDFRSYAFFKRKSYKRSPAQMRRHKFILRLGFFDCIFATIASSLYWLNDSGKFAYFSQMTVIYLIVELW